MDVTPPQGKVIFIGEKLELRIITVDTEAGPHEKEIIVHPGAAVILPLLSEQRVVLIKNTRLAIDRALWELPAGTLQPPEDPRTCALRELTEETGYTAGSLESLGAFFTNPGWSNHQLHAFCARDLTPGPSNLDPGEKITEVKDFEISHLWQMIKSGEIHDGKTIAVLALYLSQQEKF